MTNTTNHHSKHHTPRQERRTQSRWLQHKDLVIGVSSSALLDLTESDHIYRSQGVQAYEGYQTQHSHDPLKPGIAAPFISKLLTYNKILHKLDPNRGVEVIIASRNSPRTGLRAMNSLTALGLPIDKATFTSGKSPAPYLEAAYGVDLFLSANRDDVHEAARHDIPAGRIVQDNQVTPGKDPHPNELRVAFDFDGIIAGDSSERQFQQYLKTSPEVQEALTAYTQYEIDHANDPIEAGPLAGLLKGINNIQQTIESIQNGTCKTFNNMTDEEQQEILNDLRTTPTIRTYVVTARGADTVERTLNTLDSHGIHIDEMTMLAGMDKTPALEVIKPDMFFDDQAKNLTPYSSVPSVHVPLGVCNPCINNDQVREIFNQHKTTKTND